MSERRGPTGHDGVDAILRGERARSGKWQPGALRKAIIRVLGARNAGLTAARLAERTGWSVASVRRELGFMEQMRLVRRSVPDRTALWSLTRGGEILWLLAHQGEQRTPVLARSLRTTAAAVNTEAARLVTLGLVRGRGSEGGAADKARSWRLAGKTAR